MTIERPLPSAWTSSGARRHGGDAEWAVAPSAQPVPAHLRADRLSEQIRLFERAGYHLETRAGMQAVVARARPRRALRDLGLVVATAGLWLVPLLLGPRRSYHRVAITIAPDGAVRIA